jgi:hypothetical protein
MNKRPVRETTQSKVFALYKRLAGDKLHKCDALAVSLINEGYKPERAWAEALDIFKCVKNEVVDEA